MPEIGELEKLLQKYFPEQLSEVQINQFKTAFTGWMDWNSKVNLISRKDMENLAERHILHSLSIAKVAKFEAGMRILDVGTGGGFPGIPLAILFPEAEFHLVDSIGKKIKVVQDIVQQCGLTNVHPAIQRAELVDGKFDYIISRAVTSFDKFIPWVKKKILCGKRIQPAPGILYLRGGNPEEELAELKAMKFPGRIHPLKEWLDEPFFESKYIVHIGLCK